MYKVEYLIIVTSSSNAANCTTIQALKNLIQSDVNFTIQKDTITHKKYSFVYEVKSGKTTNENNIFFHLNFLAKNESEIPQFEEALKALRRVMSLIDKNLFTLWDDLNLYYAEKAYPKLFIIENLMRKLLSKFMLINLGMGWAKDRLPHDVQKSINPNNNDLNFFHNIDFIQISNFLFSDSYPTHKDSLIKKLKQAKDLTTLNLDEIKSLLPETNWAKYFESIVQCEGDYLKNRWAKLYDLRCNVAHNKAFTRRDLEEIEKLTGEIQSSIEKAIEILDTIVIPEEEKENVAENIASNRGLNFNNFIVCWQEFEKTTEILFKQHSTNEWTNMNVPNFKKFDFFLEEDIISQSDYNNLKELQKFRNIVVHGAEYEILSSELERNVEKVSFYTDMLRRYISETEKEHLNKITNSEIVNMYESLKSKILELDNLKVKFNKYYIAFIADTNVVDIHVQQKAIKVWLNMKKGTLIDTQNLTKDVSNIGHLGNGDYELHIKLGQDLNYIMELIKQSYKYNKKD